MPPTMCPAMRSPVDSASVAVVVVAVVVVGVVVVVRTTGGGPRPRGLSLPGLLEGKLPFQGPVVTLGPRHPGARPSRIQVAERRNVGVDQAWRHRVAGSGCRLARIVPVRSTRQLRPGGPPTSQRRWAEQPPGRCTTRRARGVRRRWDRYAPFAPVVRQYAHGRSPPTMAARAAPRRRGETQRPPPPTVARSPAFGPSQFGTVLPGARR